MCVCVFVVFLFPSVEHTCDCTRNCWSRFCLFALVSRAQYHSFRHRSGRCPTDGRDGKTPATHTHTHTYTRTRNLLWKTGVEKQTASAPRERERERKEIQKPNRVTSKAPEGANLMQREQKCKNKAPAKNIHIKKKQMQLFKNWTPVSGHTLWNTRKYNYKTEREREREGEKYHYCNWANVYTTNKQTKRIPHILSAHFAQQGIEEIYNRETKRAGAIWRVKGWSEAVRMGRREQQPSSVF